MAEITLALVTYNQAYYLKIFLQNYLLHNHMGIPLLIIDDGSTDETSALLKKVPPSIKVFNTSHQSIAAARNLALKNCETPWIAFSDTDCILSETYFNCIQQIPNKYAGFPALEGSVWPPYKSIPPLTHFVMNRKGGMYVTANMAYHIESINTLGGFDLAFGNYREDVDLALTILEQKKTIPFWLEWKVEHPYIPRKFWKTLKNLYTDQYKIVQTEIRLYVKHPLTYNKVRFANNAERTLKNWCQRHTFEIIKQRWIYLKENKSTSWGEWLHRIILSGESIIIAVVEQACLNIFYLNRSKN